MKISLSTAKRVIVVDVQPAYDKFIRSSFSITNMCAFLNKFPDILVLYNGRTTGMTEDDEWDVREYLQEHGLDKNIECIDKGYGYLRSLMDAGATSKEIIALLRVMAANHVNDSRELDSELYNSILRYDQEDYCISIPDLSLRQLKAWSNCYLLGGGRDECLKEIQILMNAFNLKYTLVSRFIY